MTVYEVNFEGWGWREIAEGSKLLELFFDDKMTGKFLQVFQSDPSSLTIGFNSSSGYVWLQDEDYNIAMKRNGKLDIFFTDPETGEEGFYDELSKEAKKRTGLLVGEDNYYED